MDSIDLCRQHLLNNGVDIVTTIKTTEFNGAIITYIHFVGVGLWIINGRPAANGNPSFCSWVLDGNSVTG